MTSGAQAAGAVRLSPPASRGPAADARGGSAFQGAGGGSETGPGPPVLRDCGGPGAHAAYSKVSAAAWSRVRTWAGQVGGGGQEVTDSGDVARAQAAPAQPALQSVPPAGPDEGAGAARESLKALERMPGPSKRHT